MAAFYACCGPELDDPLQTYEDVLAYLDKLGLFHMDLSLDRMKRAADDLEIRRMPCPVIQVVGTNGKGSTASFVQALAAAHGFRCGLFTSPHFISPMERIRINQRRLPEIAWARLASRVLEKTCGLTYFELLTCLAMLSFKGTQPDLIVLEAGLGGAYDATSAFCRDIVCFTPIGLDHQQILGQTPEAIARDKAAAITPEVGVALSSTQSPAIGKILAEQAAEQSVRFESNLAALAGHAPDSGEAWLEIVDQARLGLIGDFQHENARTATAVWLTVCAMRGWTSHASSVLKGLGNAFIAGRFQRIPGDPEIILDGAHNEDGLKALAATLKSEKIKPGAVIFSCLKDKDTRTLADLAGQIADQAMLIVTPIADNPRAMSLDELQALFAGQAIPSANMQEALTKAGKQGPVVICGSLYLLAEFFKLCPEALETATPN